MFLTVYQSNRFVYLVSQVAWILKRAVQTDHSGLLLHPKVWERIRKSSRMDYSLEMRRDIIKKQEIF